MGFSNHTDAYIAGSEQVQWNREIDAQSGVVRIVLGQKFDSKNVESFRTILNTEAAENNFRIILNLEHLPFIYSAQIGALWTFCQKARQNGGDLKLSALNSDVFRALETMGLTRLLSIHDTDEEALAAF